MELLAISSEKLDFREIRDSEVECNLIRDSERIFQDTFSEETIVSEENNPRCTIQNISVSVPNNSVNVVKVGLLCFCSTQFIITLNSVSMCCFCVYNCFFRKMEDLIWSYLEVCYLTERRLVKFLE